MSTRNSTYVAALAAGTSLHSNANQAFIHQKEKVYRDSYVGDGATAAGDMIDFGPPDAPLAQFIPESFRLRHDGTAAFSFYLRFAKLTMAVGTLDAGTLWNATYTRSTTTCTVTTAAPHRLAHNTVLEVTATDSAAAVPLGTTGVITVISATTFSFTCPNAGATSGSITLREYVSDLRQATHARSTTTMTVTTQGAHGLTAGELITLQSIDAASGGLAVATNYAVATVTSAVVFTVTVANSGAATGTITFTRAAGNWTPITAEAAYTEAAIWTGAGVATVTYGPLGLGGTPTFRKADRLVAIIGAKTTELPTTRTLQMSASYHVPG